MTAGSHESLTLNATPSSGIVLCLSGGGFRATFFHLGVIKLLRDYGLLQLVTEIFSVSGGSILSAHLALNWEKYSNPKPNHEPDFYRAATEIVRFGTFDLRGRIFRRRLLLGWLIPSFRLTRQLEAYYSSFLHHAELKDLPAAVPKFHFLATSLTTGQLCCFMSEGFHDGRLLHAGGQLPLALAVAASSAFPPVFPPVNITRERLHAKVQNFPLPNNKLTDGGVFDNLGVNRVRKLVDSVYIGVPSKRVIISDASAMFDWQPESRFANIFSIAGRAASIQAMRVASLEEEHWTKAFPEAIKISIHDLVKEKVPDSDSLLSTFEPQDEEVQALVGQIRTDLDKFTMEEICALVRHGYEVALDKIKTATPAAWVPSAEFQPSDPCVVERIAGWPSLEMADIIPKVRGATRLLNRVKKGYELLGEADKAIHDCLGLPIISTEKKKIHGTDEVKKLRLRLKNSHIRHIGLWNPGDLVSWVLLFGLTAFLLLILWRVSL